MEFEGQLEVAERSGILLDLRLADSPPKQARVGLQRNSSALENGLVSTHNISQGSSPRNMIDRKVRAPWSALIQGCLGAQAAVPSNLNGLTRHSLLNPGAGGPAWRRAIALLMWLATAAGMAGFERAPIALAQNLGTVALGSTSSASAVTANVRDNPIWISNITTYPQIT
jgi:hypothetical protein